MIDAKDAVPKPTAWISRVSFSGGDEFEFLPNHKVLIVGANNSGKSKSLEEMADLVGSGRQDRKRLVVQNLKVSKSGDTLEKFLKLHAKQVNDTYRLDDWQLHVSHVQYWRHDYLTNGLVGGFVRTVTAKGRLSICDQQNSISPSDVPTKPQHMLYQSDSLMKSVSAHFRRAFGSDLMFDFRGGSKLPIHVGSLPDNELKDRVSDAYTDAVRSQPLLDKQGDGIRSYAGILFETLVSGRDINFIDEPEAFLHPPQMQKLGETLAQHVAGQLFVATHSSDILRGFLEGKKGEVRILRVRREGDVNKVFEAPQDAVKELWEKPVLRYSNALEGIFHEQTILCEDHSDCRLFNSSADYLRGRSGDLWKDTAYVPTGGKDAVRKVASVLRRIGVPVKVVFDFDFLSSGDLVKETVEAFGGTWSDIEALWKRLDVAVRGGVKAKSIPEIKDGIKIIIEKAEPDKLPKSDIFEVMKQTSPWAIVKKAGTLGLPRGEAQDNYNKIKELLEDIGIYLVPVGEIGACAEFCVNGIRFTAEACGPRTGW